MKIILYQDALGSSSQELLRWPTTTHLHSYWNVCVSQVRSRKSLSSLHDLLLTMPAWESKCGQQEHCALTDTRSPDMCPNGRQNSAMQIMQLLAPQIQTAPEGNWQLRLGPLSPGWALP